MAAVLFIGGMRLSIIIPVYQSAAYLEACVRSVLDQGYADFEIMLINDGSTDGSDEICRKFAEQDSRIRYYQQSNQGVSSARNLGLAHAKGDYLTFLDSDDTLTPQTLLKMDQLVNGQQPDLIIFSINHRNLSEHPPASHLWKIHDHVYESSAAFVSDLLNGQRLLLYSCSNKVYRHDLISRHGIRFQPEVHFGEDRLFNFQYFSHAQRIVTHAHPAFHYYTRPTASLSKRYRPEHLNELLALHRAKQEWIDTLQSDHESRDTFLADDLHLELRMAWRHLLRYWPELSSQERRRDIRALTVADYPVYLGRLKRHGLATRLKLGLIEYRMTNLLHMLINLACALRPKPQGVSGSPNPSS